MQQKKTFLLAVLPAIILCLAASLVWSFTLVHISPQTEREDMQMARQIQELMNRELDAKGCDECRLELKVVKGQAEVIGSLNANLLPAVQKVGQKAKSIHGVKGFNSSKVRPIAPKALNPQPEVPSKPKKAKTDRQKDKQAPPKQP
jgi:hypothetical protein